MPNLEKLKAKLEKQKQKAADNLNVIKKEKKQKPKAFVPTQKIMQKSRAEEDFMREKLRSLLEVKHSSEIKEALKKLKKVGDAPFGRDTFLSKLEMLSKKLIRKFITEYLEQALPYSKFYDNWVKGNEDLERHLDEGYTDSPIAFFDTVAGIYRIMLERAKVFAEENGENVQAGDDYKEEEDEYIVEIMGTADDVRKYVGYKNGTYFVTEKQSEARTWDSPEKATAWLASSEAITENGEVVKKSSYNKYIKNNPDTHQELAADYIELAEALGVSDAANMKLGELSREIVTRERFLANAVPEVVFLEIEKLNERQLKNKIKKIGMFKDGETGLLKKPKIDLNQEPKFLKIGLLQYLKKYPAAQKVIVKKGLLKDENWSAGDRKTTSISGGKTEHNKKVLLVKKLGKIFGKEDVFKNWSLDQLEEKYRALEQGEEYWDEIQKNTIVDLLSKQTGKPKHVLEKMKTKKLLKLLDVKSNEWIDPTTKNLNQITLKKCVDEYQSFKWLDYTVTGVWLYPTSKIHVGEEELPDYQTIEDYATGEYIIVKNKDSNTPKRFFKAGKDFFEINCKFPKTQKGNILKIKTPGGTKKFIVGFSVSGKASGNNKIITPGYTGQKLIIQDPTIFLRESSHKERKRSEALEKITYILAEKVDEISKDKAKYFLAKELAKVAPDVKDYDFDSPFIDIAIKSVITGKNMKNTDFFSKIAELVIYLRLRQAEIFRNRVREEYYLPDILMTLSETDKFPEVFEENNFSDEEKELYVSHIHSGIGEIVNEMGEDLYKKFVVGSKRTKQPEYEPKFEVKYSTNICENSGENIPEENIIFYKDPKSLKIYCFDVEKLSLQFNNKNFVNPHTGEKFSKKFVMRYTITYTDPLTGENFVFPYKELYRSFRAGDTVNKESGREFNPSFVSSVLSGGESPEYMKKFHKMERRIAMCVNSEDVMYEPPWNIVYYKDTRNDNLYCFTIQKLSELISNGGINPYSGHAFSKKFIKRFKKLFNTSLHTGGIKQDEFADLYNLKKSNTEGGKGEMEDYNFRKSIYSSKRKLKNEPLIVPNLWEIIAQDIEERENPAWKDMDLGDEVLESKDSDEDETVQPEVGKTDKVGKIEEELNDADSNESTESRESTESNESRESNESAKTDDSSFSFSSSESESGSKDSEAKPNNLHPTICSNCKKKEGIFKSVGYDTKCHIYHFCSPKCMEDFSFVKFHGKGK